MACVAVGTTNMRARGGFAKHRPTLYPAAQMHQTRPWQTAAVLAILALGSSALDGQTLRPEDTPSVAPSPTRTKSRVVLVEKPALVNRFQIDEAGVRESFNRALQAFTRKNSPAEAWKSLVSPRDVVGLKINTAGGSILSTHPALVEAIVEGLQKAGIPPEQIVIWDKLEEQMLSAGYVPMQPQREWRCLSVIPGAGFDGEKFFFHEVAGQLIWGDRDFVGKAENAEDAVRKLLQKATEPDKATNATLDPFKPAPVDSKPQKAPPPQISNRSYFTRILTRDVTKIINLPVLTDHDRVGIHGCVSSLVLGSIDNHRRFLNDSPPAAEAIADLYANDLLQKKVVLHVMDGLVAQFAGGPAFHPHYAASPGLILVGTDPVAIDTLALERIEDWRRTRNVIPVGTKALHLTEAARIGLGTQKREEIEITLIP